jgi:hypothetical protein
MLRVHSIESQANVDARAPSDFANPSKSHRLVDLRSSFEPRELAQGGALQSPSIKVSCGGSGSGEQRRVGGQDKRPERHERW